jgi:hypothetical protein
MRFSPRLQSFSDGDVAIVRYEPGDDTKVSQSANHRNVFNWLGLPSKSSKSKQATIRIRLLALHMVFDASRASRATFLVFTTTL